LRAKVKEGTPESADLKKKMAGGELISSDYVVGLMEEYMNKSSKSIFLADGFPRNQENMDVWNKRLSGKVDVKFLLLFNLDGETMIKRLLYRASQSKVKRDDDNEETMKKRVATFEKSLPIFNIFE
jgi:UMP-CMP kinase